MLVHSKRKENRVGSVEIIGADPTGFLIITYCVRCGWYNYVFGSKTMFVLLSGNSLCLFTENIHRAYTYSLITAYLTNYCK